jgi:peptide/nickel transport system substrate-binding protein
MMEGKPRNLALASSLAVLVVAVSFASLPCLAGAQAKVKTYPRSQTLITTGSQCGNIAGFNPFFDNYAVGTVGLCYETLLRYDPLKDRYINWLARSARFTGKKTYTVVIRKGVKWSDGKPFTARDVAWNFRLGRFSTAFWHDLYSSLKSIRTPFRRVRVKLGGKTKVRSVRDRVVFSFERTPNYIQWQNLVWNLPLVAPQQAKSLITDAAGLTAFNPSNPVGTGPYRLDVAGYDPTYRVVWMKKKVCGRPSRVFLPRPSRPTSSTPRTPAASARSPRFSPVSTIFPATIWGTQSSTSPAAG